VENRLANPIGGEMPRQIEAEQAAVPSAGSAAANKDRTSGAPRLFHIRSNRGSETFQPRCKRSKA
jgi:hypothetical protein